jgi:hypothetical protein
MQAMATPNSRKPSAIHGLKVGEQHVQGAGLGQPFAEQPDGVGVGRRRAEVEAQKAQPAQPVADQILHTPVGHVVLRRQHQHLEHRHRIVGRPPALRPVRIGQRHVQHRPERLEIDNPRQHFKRIAMRRKPLQMLR